MNRSFAYSFTAFVAYSLIICTPNVGAEKPLSDYTQEISFIYYNGSTINDTKVFSYEDGIKIIHERSFDKNLRTIIYMHGWTERPMETGNYSTDIIADGFFKSNLSFNLIICNYENLVRRYFNLPSWVPTVLNELSAYGQSAYNGTHIGKAMGLFLKRFIPLCECLDNIHLIGFSIGAHIMSYAANLYGKGILPHLTGLDPAQPLYREKIFPMLSEHDGKFVDVVHSDAGCLGIGENVGTCDFWPNNGRHYQPSCTRRDAIECSHYMAPRFYAASIYAPELFLGRQCSSALAWDFNFCDNNKIVHMGYFVDKSATGSFYLRTNGAVPYGLGTEGLKK